MAESKEEQEELKSLLMKVKEDNEKAGLKLNIQKIKIMASGPISSWQIDEENVETLSDFIFLGSKMSVDSDCSHTIERHLLLGRKAMTNLDSILSPPFLPALNLSQHQCLPMSQLFASGGQSIGASASASVHPVSIQG